MNLHFKNAKIYIYRNLQTYSFVRYFDKFSNNKNDLPIDPMVHKQSKFKILQSSNILDAMKDFGTDKCKLCMKERLEILKREKDNPNLVIN